MANRHVGIADPLTQFVCFGVQVAERIRKNFARNLETARKSKGITLRELAEASRVSPSTLARVKAPGENLTLDVIARLAEAVGSDPLELLADPEVGAKPQENPEMNVLRSRVETYQTIAEALAKVVKMNAPDPDPEDAHLLAQYKDARTKGGEYFDDLLDLWSKASPLHRLCCLVLLAPDRIDFARKADDLYEAHVENQKSVPLDDAIHALLLAGQKK